MVHKERDNRLPPHFGMRSERIQSASPQILVSKNNGCGTKIDSIGDHVTRAVVGGYRLLALEGDCQDGPLPPPYTVVLPFVQPGLHGHAGPTGAGRVGPDYPLKTAFWLPGLADFDEREGGYPLLDAKKPWR